MGFMDLFRRKEPVEARSSGAGYTAAIMAAREAYISGSSGLAELTGTVQTCVSLWEGAFALADVDGAPMLTRATMARTARALALRGEAVWLIDGDRVVPVSDWDISTRDGEPRAYRLSVPDAGGGTRRTALAAEVLHFRGSVDISAPWAGSAPLRRARLTASLLHALETALGEVYDTAPLGSQIVPFPETDAPQMERLTRSFRGSRGRVLVRESVNVSAAGGPTPTVDWQPRDLSPDLSKSMTRESLEAAQAGVLAAFGVLPAMLTDKAQGPLIREAQRHLATWVLQPMAELLAEEASGKLGGPVAIDVHRPLQSFDAGGSARAAAGMIQALAQAKDAGLGPAAVAAVFGALDWSEALKGPD
ncbi:hypothetical protein GCM10011392_38730 [Wenxinia marina]|uniref:Phage-related protein n=2 Tax=Wenxinia TaxID=653686 RepID=A0A0D0QEK0_9RHOB|nr:phage portal protein [Wenxinia marina]KIQ70757.1 Phage-related protein [Wenxinia marina DSM 24838]GGL80385.1 hypothetical protein GCM10011392_38730 [Wenxinia marina]